MGCSNAYGGFTVSDLASQVRVLSKQSESEYGARRAAYDLKKLRGKKIVRRIGQNAQIRVDAERTEGPWLRWWFSETKRSSPCWRLRRSYGLRAARRIPERSMHITRAFATPCRAFSRNWGWPPKDRQLFFSGFALKRRMIISQRFFGIPPFRFYALADGIRRILSHATFSPPEMPPPSQQLELTLGWEG